MLGQRNCLESDPAVYCQGVVDLRLGHGPRAGQNIRQGLLGSCHVV